MRKPLDVRSLLFGRTREHVLDLLLQHPTERYYMRELAYHAQVAASSVQREVDLLVAADLITRVRSGHQIYFQINQASPVFPEIQSLFQKTARQPN
ncbi:MAG TPA: winged helix-turn-helix domain-containing protein [Vicinamibacterales bacterium]|nr:winged helix-turn-helix domain-containing protein [Vicinamibacterales bacterium]